MRVATPPAWWRAKHARTLAEGDHYGARARKGWRSKPRRHVAMGNLQPGQKMFRRARRGELPRA